MRRVFSEGVSRVAPLYSNLSHPPVRLSGPHNHKPTPTQTSPSEKTKSRHVPQVHLLRLQEPGHRGVVRGLGGRHRCPVQLPPVDRCVRHQQFASFFASLVFFSRFSALGGKTECTRTLDPTAVLPVAPHFAVRSNYPLSPTQMARLCAPERPSARFGCPRGKKCTENGICIFFFGENRHVIHQPGLAPHPAFSWSLLPRREPNRFCWTNHQLPRFAPA